MIAFNSIHTRMTGAALVFIVGTSIAMGVIGAQLTSSFLDERYHDNFRVLTEYFARNAELGVVLRDSRMLGELAEKMLDLEDISRVNIFDVDGKLLAQKSKENLAGDHAMVSKEIRDMRFTGPNSMFLSESDADSVVSGRAEVEYSLNNLRAVKEIIVRRYLFFVVLFSLVPVVWFYFVSRSVSAPLTRLLEVCRIVSRGNMEVRVETSATLREVSTLGVTFNEMLTAIKKQRLKADEAHAEMLKQRSLAEVGKFSMMVAHEIKNPLAVIKGSIEIMKNPSTPSETREMMVMYIDEDVQRINKLVEEFLEFSRPKKPNFALVDMNELIHHLMEKLKVMADHCRFEFVLDRSRAMALCDIHLMERAMLNLVRNAGQFSKQDSGICITTCIREETWRVSVEDNGKGLDQDQFEHLFEPFYTTRARGTGLGLAITREIVESQGGVITAANREGQGACFEIALPLSSDDSGENRNINL